MPTKRTLSRDDETRNATIEECCAVLEVKAQADEKLWNQIMLGWGKEFINNNPPPSSRLLRRMINALREIKK